MRIAILSDIHANLEALIAVLEDIEKQDLDAVLCLGDVVGYGPDPVECINTMKTISLFVLAGNHDHAAVDLTSAQDFNPVARAAVEWTRRQLDEPARAYLASLPLTRQDLGVYFVHGSPFRPEEWNYILSAADAGRAFDCFEEPVCFVGHSHVPLVLELGQDGRIRYRDPYGTVFQGDRRYIVNVGSVGQPRDGDPRAAYGIWDRTQKAFELRRVAYDVQSVQRKILQAGLPPLLAYRLAYGQ
ncbi:MAG: metallophosphatase family protein [candidate division KSB1 bacterium]|nr:metallophosphatase family protein [candidate division KSB1 bacterium]